VYSRRAAEHGYSRGVLTSRTVPNLVALIVNLVYHLSLAIWIGGGIALGALTAPELFRQLPRPQAGGIFGPILRRFSRLRLAAVFAALAAAAAKHLLWEGHSASGWIAVRWVALAAMTVIVVYELLGLEPAMAAYRGKMAAEASDSDPARAAFLRLHRRSEALMKVGLLAALVALFLS
jgi:uncharacterized membrane protein